MSLLGTLIRKGLEVNQSLAPRPKPPRLQQEEELRNLILTAQETAFGQYHGFRHMYSAPDIVKAFKAEVPIHTYEKMHGDWWHKQQVYENITWPGKPAFFALSSGTTGKSSKRIPVTEDIIESMRKVGLSLVRNIPDFDLPDGAFEGEVMMLSSSASLSEHEYGHLEGEISGINVSNFPGWYDLFVRPGSEIATIGDWDSRIKRIVEEAPNWNIGSMAGIPSWNLLMIKEIMAHHKLDTIHDIWPNLSLYANGGVAFETYRADFEAVWGKPVTVIDTYLASEGFFAYTAQPDTMAMRLAMAHGYFFEFIPFDERGVDGMGNLLEDPVSLNIDEVKLEEEYVLVVSTCAGAWRYAIGDTVKFTQLDPPEIKITGRTKFFLNVVGSQLSEEKLDAGILEAAKALDVSVNEYSVAALKNQDDQYYHQWIVVSEQDINADEFAQHLDKSLQDSNKNYGVARHKALHGVEVKAISKQQYHDYLASQKKKGGQVKTPKVMPAEKMQAYLEFISS